MTADPVNLSQQDIIDYASRYVPSNEIVDFPCDGDLFCLLGRELPAGKILADEEGWAFRGYGVCLGYTLDEEAKPPGKWVWMRFASLMTFPPAQQVYKLQPPHVVRGRFQNPERTQEFRIIKVGVKQAAPQPAGVFDPPPAAGESASAPLAPPHPAGKIVQFRKKGA